MTKPMTEQSASTKLLTLINVNQARPSKRKRLTGRDWYQVSKEVLTNAPSPSTAKVVLAKTGEDSSLDVMNDSETLMTTDSGQ